MAKDPAMLWYWGDWNSGTSLFSRFLKGCYIDLLHAQFNHGHLSIEEIKTCLGSDFGSSWPTIQKKFKQDGNGLFFNERLDLEKEKRKAFTKSRKDNLSKTPHMDNHMAPHMDSHMDNENVNGNSGREVPITITQSTGEEKRIQEFLTNKAWKEEFCMTKKIPMHELELIQCDFVNDTKLKGEFVDSYKRYFTNWYNKTNPTVKTISGKKMVQ